MMNSSTSQDFSPLSTEAAQEETMLQIQDFDLKISPLPNVPVGARRRQERRLIWLNIDNGDYAELSGAEVLYELDGHKVVAVLSSEAAIRLSNGKKRVSIPTGVWLITIDR